MALFVDLDEEAEPPQAHDYHRHGIKPEWNGELARQLQSVTTGPVAVTGNCNGVGIGDSWPESGEPLKPSPVLMDVNRNGMTEALGCYPIIMAIAASIDLNTLDNLSRTCRAVRSSLLQYRSALLAHTMHCENENIPIDPEDTFRYRARAGNWYYMEDGRGDYNGKSGSCARDMVAECRRCAKVVCRNCAIKPPAPVVLRDRHRRLCVSCTKAPLPSLVKPPLLQDTPIDADEMQQAVCTCVSEGVWLCQPCGRSIRGADHDYQSIWKWRNQYGEVLGGVGIGIGEGDRGVICGREDACCSFKEREQETDCDAEDAREQQQDALSFISGSPSPPWSTASTPDGGNFLSTSPNMRRTPTPTAQLRPGYARHEVEGIGGVVKTMLLKTVKVGACVPEWEDEKSRGEILGREVSGRRRSWCGWCLRVIPGKKDYEAAAKGQHGNDSPRSEIDLPLR